MATMMMMDEHQQEPPVAQLSSTYPSAPMEYVNMYTNENVKSGKAPVPPKIIKENYSSFGKFIDPNEILIQSLENQGIERLYSLAQLPTPPPSSDESTTNASCQSKTNFIDNTDNDTKPQNTKIEVKSAISETSLLPAATTGTIGKKSLIYNYPINTNNHKRELKKLNHSILVAYLDLLDILVHAPNTQIEIEAPKPPPTSSADNADPLAIAGGQAVTAADGDESSAPNVILKSVREQKLGDLEILFINMHHLINELRPHQARDSLRCILEMQRKQRVDMAVKFKNHLTKVVDLLHNCIKSIEPKSDQEMSDELKGLIANANDLGNKLDELSSVKQPALPPLSQLSYHNANNFEQQKISITTSNGFIDHRVNEDNDENDDDNDVEMKSFETDENETNEKINSKKKAIEEVIIDSGGGKSSKDERTTCSSGRGVGFDLSLKNCDFRDLIFCDLIDEEFKIKESEF